VERIQAVVQGMFFSETSRDTTPMAITILSLVTRRGFSIPMAASSYPISDRGAGELLIKADHYKSGTHIYDLVADGKSAGARKMLVE